MADQIITVTNAAVQALTIPSGATRAVIQVQGQPIRWRIGSTNPTPTVGAEAAAGDELTITGRDMASFKAIATGADSTLVVTYANVTVDNGATNGATSAGQASQLTELQAIRSLLDVLSGTYGIDDVRNLLATLTVTDNTTTIASGASLSGAINLAGLTVVRISMPAAWTAADLTVQTSRDGVAYQDLYDQYGSPYVIKAGAGRNINLNPADLLGVRYIRLQSATVSGSTITPVNQAAARDLNIVAANV